MPERKWAQLFCTASFTQSLFLCSQLKILPLPKTICQKFIMEHIVAKSDWAQLYFCFLSQPFT